MNLTEANENFINALNTLEVENKEELINNFKTISSESIKSYQSKDQEALKYKSYLKDLGYDKEQYETFDAFKQSISKTKETAENSALTLSQLNEKFEALNSQYTAEVSKREAKEQELKDTKIRSKLIETIGDKVYGSDVLIENIMLKRSLSVVDDRIVDKDGNSFEDFTKTLLESQKDNLKPTQKGGFDNKVKSGAVAPSTDSFIDKVKQRMKK